MQLLIRAGDHRADVNCRESLPVIIAHEVYPRLVAQVWLTKDGGPDFRARRGQGQTDTSLRISRCWRNKISLYKTKRMQVSSTISLVRRQN